MEKILLICEIFIAIFGIYAVIIADNTHERLHGLFVVGLALEGVLSNILGLHHPLTETVLIILSLIALLMIVISTHSMISHVKAFFKNTKDGNKNFNKPSLIIEKKEENFADYFDNRFDKLESMILDRQAELDLREKDLEEREAKLLEKVKELEIEQSHIVNN